MLTASNYRLAIFKLPLFKHLPIIVSIVSQTPILFQGRQNNMLEDSMESTFTLSAHLGSSA